MVGSGGGFYGISDEVAGLEGVGHAEGAHADAVADADSAVLVGDGVGCSEGVFDAGAEGEEVLVASGEGERGRRGGGETDGFPSYQTLATPTKGLWRSAGSLTGSVA